MQMSSWDEKEAKKIVKNFLFITHTLKIKSLKNIDLLQELPFYDEIKYL